MSRLRPWRLLLPGLLAMVALDVSAATTTAPKPAAPPAAVQHPAAGPPPAAAPPAIAAPAPPAAPITRELHFSADVEAEQTWKKNDPKYPGDQWSKGSTKQHYEVTTRLRSDGRLEVRNLLDPNIDARMEAKTIHLARQAKKVLEQPGQPLHLPRNDQEKMELMRQMQQRLSGCNGDPTCSYEMNLQFAEIMAALQYPDAMQDDTVPGRYQYFLPYGGCPEKSRVTLTMQIEGVRYNKDVDKFIPFSEHHQADTVDASDGLSLCAHLAAVIDTQDPAKSMYQETIFVPRPEGVTDYTENGHVSHTPQPQPTPTAAIEWMNEVLRHAPPSGSATATLPLSLPLNGNATWLGLWTGTVKVSMQWSFAEVPTPPPEPPKK